MSQPTPEQIDLLLPQTQCGLCGYGGCMPYAEALVYEKAAINLCPPGGTQTLQALGEILRQDPMPYMAEMKKATKPRVVAVIREAECIGCTKCIQACPVDSILGTAKRMHTVITDECTGCELCVAPCPVDCIDLIDTDDTALTIDHDKANLARQRYQNRTKRLTLENQESRLRKLNHSKTKKVNYIEEAIARAKAKKLAALNTKA